MGISYITKLRGVSENLHLQKSVKIRRNLFHQSLKNSIKENSAGFVKSLNESVLSVGSLKSEVF